MNSDQKFVLAMSVLFGFVLPVTLAIVIPWAKARARRQSGGADRQTDLELDGLRDRMAELEERLDFTERLVTEAREQLRIHPARAGDA